MLWTGALLACGLVLFVVTVACEQVWPMGAFEPLARGLFRIGFFIRSVTFPLLSPLLLELTQRHWDWSLSHHFVSSFLAPFIWAGGVWGLIRFVRLFRLDADVPDEGTRDHDTKSGAFSRRGFLLSSAAGLPVAAGAGLGFYGVLIEPQRLRVARYTLPVRDLPAGLDGIRLVHISDTHYGPYMSLPYIEAAVAKANAVRPDVALLTGDYVHHTARAIPDGIGLFRNLDTRLGTVAVLGNHDHWEGADACREAFRSTGIPLMDNTRLFLGPEGFQTDPEQGKAICLGGVGDEYEDVQRFDLAVQDAPQDMPRLVLAHNPDSAEHVPDGKRVDLMLCGHTHGGQVWVPGLGTPVVPSRYGQKYVGGLVSGPQCPVLVSRGVGMAVLPVRFGVPPEIGLIELRRPEA